MTGYLLRALVTPRGILLAPWPDAAGCAWLEEWCAGLEGHELSVSILDLGVQCPAWAAPALRQLEGAPPRLPGARTARRALAAGEERHA